MTTTAESLRDVRVFAEKLIGEKLWKHQVLVALSNARTRVMCCGRQSGKSRTLAVISLWTAFIRANQRILILSAGEDAAKRLMEEIVRLCDSPLLKGSQIDANRSRVTFTNGSVIECVPASEKQVRGHSVDLLVLDEAAQITDELWRAARYAIIARPNSRVLMASTPFGSKDRFFAQAFRLGQSGEEDYESFHWPSSRSPLVDRKLIASWKKTDPEWVFRQEVLAEWVQDEQAYFRAEDLLNATCDYDLLSPERAVEYGPGFFSGGAAGIDWGFANDASAVCLLTPVDDKHANSHMLRDKVPFYLPWLESASRMPYSEFVERLMVISRAFRVEAWASEINGVGEAPTQQFQERLQRAGSHQWVYKVFTTAARKQSGFGLLQVLLQENRLILPRHAELLRQLNALTFTFSPGGSVKISVPDQVGHDDLAMALMQAASCVYTFNARRGENPNWGEPNRWDGFLETPSGLRLPQVPFPVHVPGVIGGPAGKERGRNPGW